ncbi:unnamed protein product [Nippostrongylus brasiliensis]|uniref:Uncharacterized protein n=1 Tax=Nippostrongylus brasiliensis TaxID=27835 RepID=A0A0N4YA87_NIPBR|nr:unnamed protein product [Nippostrongylus brasiliensis]
MATMTTPDSDNAESYGSAPLSFRAPVSNCAKSIIDRKLRKFASETSFATETASESSMEREVAGELHTSCTSATIHSLESAAAVIPNDDRRPSHVYMIDDDSIHEFEDDDGKPPVVLSRLGHRLVAICS